MVALEQRVAQIIGAGASVIAVHISVMASRERIAIIIGAVISIITIHRVTRIGNTARDRCINADTSCTGVTGANIAIIAIEQVVAATRKEIVAYVHCARVTVIAIQGITGVNGTCKYMNTCAQVAEVERTGIAIIAIK